VLPFTPALEKSFNRGFTSYFLAEPRPNVKMASLLTPKSQGEPVGTVKSVKPDGSIIATLTTAVANGDGLVYFDAAGAFSGFRVNRAEGGHLFPASRPALRPGTVLYRNSDAAFEREASRSASRTIAVDMRLWLPASGGVALEITDERGISIAAALHDLHPDAARTSQAEAQQRVLSKLGGSMYHARHIDTAATTGIFIPASTLTTLRRTAFALLESNARINYRRDNRRKENLSAQCPLGTSLTRHDNVANSLAERVYRDHGVSGTIAPAAEVAPALEKNPTVMTTRYCLRRELGACLRTPQGATLTSPLILTTDIAGERCLQLRLDFDCANCRMHVVKL
jgi:putative protease